MSYCWPFCPNSLCGTRNRNTFPCHSSSSSTRRLDIPHYEVFMHVYDLSPANSILGRLGLGLYHTSVQVHGREFAFLGHDQPFTGIIDADPEMMALFARIMSGGAKPRVMSIGWTTMDMHEVALTIAHLSKTYRGTDYQLVRRNCNNFTEELVEALCKASVPAWINRAARTIKMMGLEKTVTRMIERAIGEDAAATGIGHTSPRSSLLSGSGESVEDRRAMCECCGKSSSAVHSSPKAKNQAKKSHLQRLYENRECKMIGAPYEMHRGLLTTPVLIQLCLRQPFSHLLDNVTKQGGGEIESVEDSVVCPDVSMMGDECAQPGVVCFCSKPPADKILKVIIIKPETAHNEQ